jgi:hypothetical protein
MAIDNTSFRGCCPRLVRQQFQTAHLLTALVCWMLLLASPLAPQRKQQALGADMYVMF